MRHDADFCIICTYNEQYRICIHQYVTKVYYVIFSAYLHPSSEGENYRTKQLHETIIFTLQRQRSLNIKHLRHLTLENLMK
jgi:hypothetical protein